MDSLDLLVSGNVVVDHTSRLYFAKAVRQTDKVNADNSHSVGGSVFNVLRALTLISAASDTSFNAKAFVAFGRPPDNDYFAQARLKLAEESFKKLGIEYENLREGEGLIADNIVLEHQDSRDINKDDKRGGNPIILLDDADEKIEEDVARANLIMIDPREPEIGALVAREALKQKKFVMVPWSLRSWPEDPKLAEAYDIILQAGASNGIITAPDDAVIKGMDAPDPANLLNNIHDVYKAKNILVSNGKEPVSVLINNVASKISVSAFEGEVFTNGAGDTRDAALLHCLLKHYTMPDACYHATQAASIKVRHNDDKWANAFVQHMKPHMNPPTNSALINSKS